MYILKNIPQTLSSKHCLLNRGPENQYPWYRDIRQLSFWLDNVELAQPEGTLYLAEVTLYLAKDKALMNVPDFDYFKLYWRNTLTFLCYVHRAGLLDNSTLDIRQFYFLDPSFSTTGLFIWQHFKFSENIPKSSFLFCRCGDFVCHSKSRAETWLIYSG